jgi:acyl-CoA synthetase (AMP-forming)/AMP-acid ligase II
MAKRLTPSPLLPDILRRRARRHPRRIAYILLKGDGIEAERVSYGQLYRRAEQYAALLRDAPQQGPVALSFPTGSDFTAALFGCFYAGRPAIPTPSPHPGAWTRLNTHLAAVLKDSQARVGLSPSEYTDRLTESSAGRNVRWLAAGAKGVRVSTSKHTVRPNDLAVIQYTSGSTADPRGVEVLHRNFATNVDEFRKMTGASEAAIFTFWLPHFHDFCLVAGILQSLHVGGTLVAMAPHTFSEQPERWLRALADYRGQITAAPNFAYDGLSRRLFQKRLDLSSVHTMINGSEMVRADSIASFNKTFKAHGLGDALCPGYGLAESTLVVSLRKLSKPVFTVQADRQALARGRYIPGTGEVSEIVSAGDLLPGLDVRIVQPRSRKVLKDGHIGEIWIKGSSVARGYWRKPKLSAQRFKARTHDGRGPYMRTGDMGFLLQGEIFITGRIKDMVIVRGRNVHAEDMEWSAVSAHADVANGGCAAVALPGEKTVILAELRREAWRRRKQVAASVRKCITQRLKELYGVAPKQVVLVRPRHLPKTTSGKVRRGEARRLWQTGKLEVVS